MAFAGDAGLKPDLMVWGTVAPNLHWSNIAREIALDAGLSPYIPAFSVVMAWTTGTESEMASRLAKAPSTLAKGVLTPEASHKVCDVIARRHICGKRQHNRSRALTPRRQGPILRPRPRGALF